MIDTKLLILFLLVLGLQDRWQPIREDQLAIRTNDCWLPGETGPRTNGRGPTILCLSLQLYMLLPKGVAINVWTMEVTCKEQRNEHVRQPYKCLLHVTDVWVWLSFAWKASVCL